MRAGVGVPLRYEDRFLPGEGEPPDPAADPVHVERLEREARQGVPLGFVEAEGTGIDGGAGYRGEAGPHDGTPPDRHHAAVPFECLKYRHGLAGAVPQRSAPAEFRPALPTGPHRRDADREAPARKRVYPLDQPGLVVHIRVAQPGQVRLAERADTVPVGRRLGLRTQDGARRFRAVVRDRATHRAQRIGKDAVRADREGVEVDVDQRAPGTPGPGDFGGGHRRHRAGGQSGHPPRWLFSQPWVPVAHGLAYRVMLVGQAAAELRARDTPGYAGDVAGTDDRPTEFCAYR